MTECLEVTASERAIRFADELRRQFDVKTTTETPTDGPPVVSFELAGVRVNAESVKRLARVLDEYADEIAEADVAGELRVALTVSD